MRHHDHVGVAEIAQLLKVTRQRVHKISQEDPTFPAPADHLQAGKVWHTEDVLDWIEKRRAAP